MHTWLPRLAKIRLPGLSHGTGWAVGRAGVLTARSVVAPLLDGVDGKPPVEGPAEVVLAATPDRSFPAAVIWDDPARDLAILLIAERGRLTWQTALRSHGQPLLAYPRLEELPAITVCGLARSAKDSEASALAWILAPAEQADGTITLGRDRDARAMVEVDRGHLSKSAARQGLVGAAVLAEESEPMLLGIVTGKVRGRRRTRFEFSQLPDPDDDEAFRAALIEAGAPAVVYHMDGPLLRRYATEASLDEALRPLPLSAVRDPGWFGTRPARADIATDRAPYGPYITRPERAVLTEVLGRAVAGDGPRFIVVRGPSAAGKSRLVAEVLAAHPGLAEYRILAPRRTVPVLDLPERLWPGRLVIWVDNLQDLPAHALRHDQTYRDLADHPGTIVLVTVTDPPDPAHGLRLIDRGAARRPEDDLGAVFPLASASLSGVQCVIDDEALTVTVPVAARPPFAPRGADEAVAQRALAAAAEQRLGLGEYLSGYHELADHYTAARWPTRVLVEMVADWGRSGIGEVLPLPVARRLWDRLVPVSLPRDELRRFHQLSPAETERHWARALAYASELVAGSGSLIRQRPDGLMASEFARTHIDHGAISAALWDYLLGEHPTTPAQRLSIGLRALESGTPQRALRAFESILYFRDDDRRDLLVEVVARRGIALYHAMSGRDEQAIMVYTDLVDTSAGSADPDICEQVAQALLGIGITFSRLGSDGQAVSAYTELVTRYRDHPSAIIDVYVAQALLGQATTLGQLGRHEEERAAYADITARYGEDATPTIAAIVEVARGAVG